MDQGQKRMRRERTIFIIVILVLILLLSCPLFWYFHISTGARLALRSAKNVRLAFIATDIEYYGRGISIYNAENVDGMNRGVRESVQNLVDEKADFTITSYNKKTRTVTGFVYDNGRFLVTYTQDTEGDHWKVRYLMPIMNLKDV